MSRYQKCTTNQDFTEAGDSEWQWHQLGRMQVCTSTPPLSFLQAGCPFCRPTNRVKALKAYYKKLLQLKTELLQKVTIYNYSRESFIHDELSVLRVYYIKAFSGD